MSGHIITSKDILRANKHFQEGVKAPSTSITTSDIERISKKMSRNNGPGKAEGK